MAIDNNQVENCYKEENHSVNKYSLISCELRHLHMENRVCGCLHIMIKDFARENLSRIYVYEGHLTKW